MRLSDDITLAGEANSGGIEIDAVIAQADGLRAEIVEYERLRSGE
jgi:hypothetical protein